MDRKKSEEQGVPVMSACRQCSGGGMSAFRQRPAIVPSASLLMLFHPAYGIRAVAIPMRI